MFVDANMLANFGVDRYNNEFPIYLQNFGGGQSVMYVYLTALLIKIFSPSYLLIRAISVIFGILVIIFSYLISKEFRNINQSLLIMAMVSFCPYFIQASRIGLDCNLLLGMSMIALYSFIKTLKMKKNFLYIISGILFGLCLYTYAISYIFISLFVIITLIILYKNKYISKKEIFIFLISFFIIILPIILFLLVNYGITKEQKLLIFSINKLLIFRSNEISPFLIIENIPNLFDILSYDMIEYNSLPLFGTIYYIFIPFFIIGFIKYTKKIYKNIKYKIFDLEDVMYIIFICNIITILMISAPNINKANAIFFPLIYITSYGIFNIKNRIIKRIIPILLILNFSFFGIYYFKIYKNIDNNYFDNEIYKIISDNHEFIKDKNINIISQNIEPNIYINLGKIPKTKNKDELISKDNPDEDTIYIIDKKYYNQYKESFENNKEYNNYYILYN